MKPQFAAVRQPQGQRQFIDYYSYLPTLTIFFTLSVNFITAQTIRGFLRCDMKGSGSKIRYPAETDEAFPEVFTVPPPQPEVTRPGQLTPDQVKDFFEKGFVFVPDYFKSEELDAVKASIDEVVDEFAKWLHKNGKIPKIFNEYGFEERLTHINNAFPGAAFLLHKNGVLKQAMRDLWTNARLMNAVEQLIGPDIAGHPVWNLRTKTPQLEAAVVPWHQDVGYLDNDSYKVLQPAAWIPLVDATEETGCMEFITGSHRTGRVGRHTACWATTHYVMMDEADIEATLDVNVQRDRVVVPVPYGSMVLLNNLVVHRSLPNVSKRIRWSMDFRWQTPDKPCGFHGLKDSIPFRLSKDPGYMIDWKSCETAGLPEHPTDDDFDDTVQGPWMTRWEITHENKHTAKLKAGQPLTWHM